MEPASLFGDKGHEATE